MLAQDREGVVDAIRFLEVCRIYTIDLSKYSSAVLKKDGRLTLRSVLSSCHATISALFLKLSLKLKEPFFLRITLRFGDVLSSPHSDPCEDLCDSDSPLCERSPLGYRLPVVIVMSSPPASALRSCSIRLGRGTVLMLVK